MLHFVSSTTARRFCQ